MKTDDNDNDNDDEYDYDDDDDDDDESCIDSLFSTGQQLRGVRALGMYYKNHQTVKQAWTFISLPHSLSSTAPSTFVAEFKPSPCGV